jgi:PAS domain S-box-containing protein
VAIGKLNTIYLGCYGGGVACLDWTRFSKDLPFGILQEHALIDTVLFDKAGRLWAARSGAGLLCFDGENVSTNDVLSLPEKLALALFEDSRGRIWLSDPKRVEVFEKGKWWTPTPEPGLALESVRAFAEDQRTGVMWLGAYNGDLYQCSNDVIRRVVPSGDALKGAIIALLSDGDGTLWLGSVGSGLGRLRNGQLKWIDRRRGLPATEIGSVLDDGLGSLWMGSHRGIIRANRAELNAVADGRQNRLRCRVFDTSDGMPVAECSTTTQPSAAKDLYDRLWFGTQKGVVVVTPRFQSKNTNPPLVHIEAVDFVEPDGRARHFDQPFPAKLVLPAGTKRLQIHYIGLSLGSPEKVTYRQRVTGVDRDWMEVGHEQSATLQDPGPGTFQFRVTAANAEGIWNETGASLAYTVLPTFWQTAWFRGLVGLLLVGEGVMILGLVANHWRSSRLRAELRDNQGRWDMASVAAKLGLWTWDVNTDKFWATDNAYALLGRSSSEAITFQQVEEAQHPDDRESAKKALHRALQHEHEYDTEFRVLSADGEPRWLGARGVVDFDKNGKAARLRGVWIDLTARKNLEIETARQRAELAHMGRVAIMGELSGSLAHEVNQPLTAILSNAQAAQRFLERTPLNMSEVRAILTDIVAEDRRAGEVIRRMRSLLRKGMPEFQPVDVNKLVQQVLMLMHSDLVSRNVPVMTHLAPGLPLVQGDPVQVQQVLLNLILNGCDAMQDRSDSERELLIETKCDGKDQVRISVTDRGIGAPPSMIEKMFDPFVTTKSQGLGMGLALSRSIIAAHGGRIWAAINEGPGLTLSFTLKVNLEATT